MKAFRSTLFIGLALFCLAGCGQNAKISGTVTLDEKPLIWGSVNLMDAEGKVFQGQIQPDGKYTIEGVPYGKFNVMVYNRDPRPPVRETKIPEEVLKMRKNPKPRELAKPVKEFHSRWFAIPEKYQDYATSGLSLDVDRSSMVFDIPLTK